MTTWEHGRLTTHPARDAYRSSHGFAVIGGKVTFPEPGSTWEDTLVALGNDGWELAAINDEVDEKGRVTRVFYLKRELL